ncbi:PHP domain-containing protein [Thermotoga profunda]|uniref:PHP domain-containing protein n=1 Tax=Thermotoga profunda TaxID=1508420 RepID=UPI000694D89F|nr:PHP domain-containing protein [Thermotoga profunda]
MIKADLHVHSCLSPCAQITMVPSVISQKIKEKQMDIISITDHNSCRNLVSFAKRINGFFIPGVELTSFEEVHVLAYFHSIEAASNLCDFVKKFLPKTTYDPELMGYQIIVNEQDEFQNLEEDFLGLALQLSLTDLVDIICSYEGIPVYAHIERRFGVLYQLGVFPKDDRVKLAEARSKEGWIQGIKSGFVVLSSSDAHAPDEIGCRFTRFAIEDLNLKELFDVLSMPSREKVLSIWD